MTSNGARMLTASGAAVALSIVTAAVTGVWKFSEANAWASDIRRVEGETSDAIRSVRCSILQDQLRQLELKAELDELSEREQAWMTQLIREWEADCVSIEQASEEIS